MNDETAATKVINKIKHQQLFSSSWFMECYAVIFQTILIKCTNDSVKRTIDYIPD